MPATPVVDVYPYRFASGPPEVEGPGEGRLALGLGRRAPGRRHAGAWRRIGGSVEAGETAWQAALRELAEETGFAPGAGLVALWTLPSVNTFYDWQRDAVISAFAAHVQGEPRLDAERDAFAWWPPAEAAGRLAWPEQRRLLTLAAHCVEAEYPPRARCAPRWTFPRRLGPASSHARRVHSAEGWRKERAERCLGPLPCSRARAVAFGSGNAVSPSPFFLFPFPP